MQTAVSIPDRVFEQAETVAERLSMSRSELYTRAIQQFLEAHQHDAVTEKLNEAYADEDSSVDAAVMAMQATALEDDECDPPRRDLVGAAADASGFGTGL